MLAFQQNVPPPITYYWTVPLILDTHILLGTGQIQKLLKQKRYNL